MVSKRSSKKSRSRAGEFLQKPRGVIHPRVQKVGPEHFGIVCVDCAKARSKWALTDFYGRVLVPPTEVEHNRVELAAMVAQVRATLVQHDLRDCLVAIERTSRYHHPIKNTFAQAGFETRVVHPYATKQFRQPANPDYKTDEFGWDAIDNRVHVHDLHATILHLLGFDHEKFTYRYAGRDFRLTDVAGNVVRNIVA